MQEGGFRGLNPFSIAAFLAVCFFTYLMLLIVLPYITPPYPTDIDFLITKQKYIHLSHYLAAFYVHITTSLFVLIGGGLQFSKYLLKKYPVVHRKVGQLYVFLILLFSAPSGLVMSWYANGGAAAVVAFIFLSTSWWVLTFLAYRTALQHRWEDHGKYMTYSYALTLSAVTLRLYNFLFFYFADYHSLSADQIYVLISYMSWSINIIIAYFLIKSGYLKRLIVK